jgi:glycosyltransferase involved in cell wall biosynthesis
MTARHILVCLHDFSRGGTERVAIGLTTRWADAGRDVTILCGNIEGGLRSTVSDKVKVVPLKPAVRRGFCSRRRLAHAMGKHLGEIRPDVIFLPGNFHALLANSLHAADSRPAIALKISNPPLPHRVPLAARVFRHITRTVDGFAAMNSGLAQELNAMLPARNIVTLRDPVYVSQKPHTKRHDDKQHILWVGRMESQKDPELALQVIERMDASSHLTMLGEGTLSARVMRRISELGLQSKVTLAGYVPEIDSYLGDTDVLLITSWYEGGPAVAVEALAYGIPVVSTDCSFLLHDILTRAETGRIVTSREPRALATAVAEVVAAPRETEILQELVAPFEPNVCAQAYLDWLDGLVRHG